MSRDSFFELSKLPVGKFSLDLRRDGESKGWKDGGTVHLKKIRTHPKMGCVELGKFFFSCF